MNIFNILFKGIKYISLYFEISEWRVELHPNPPQDKIE